MLSTAISSRPRRTSSGISPRSFSFAAGNTMVLMPARYAASARHLERFHHQDFAARRGPGQAQRHTDLVGLTELLVSVDSVSEVTLELARRQCVAAPVAGRACVRHLAAHARDLPHQAAH